MLSSFPLIFIKIMFISIGGFGSVTLPNCIAIPIGIGIVDSGGVAL